VPCRPRRRSGPNPEISLPGTLMSAARAVAPPSAPHTGQPALGGGAWADRRRNVVCLKCGDGRHCQVNYDNDCEVRVYLRVTADEELTVVLVVNGWQM